MVPQYNGTHYSEHLGIVNITKAIVARVFVSKKTRLVEHFPHKNVISYGFQYNEHQTPRALSVRYTEVLL